MRSRAVPLLLAVLLPALLRAQIWTTPLKTEEKPGEAPWTRVGQEAAGSLTVARAGEVALLLNGPTNRRACKLLVTVGAHKLEVDLAADSRAHYLGRATLPVGRHAVRARLEWMADGTGAALGSALEVAAVGLPAEAPARGPAALELMCPLFHKWQMERAPAMVDTIAGLGAKRVQFVIALQSELDESFRVLNYGLVLEDKAAKEGSRFFPMTEEIRTRLRGWLAAAFARAAYHDLKVDILLHLNAQGKVQEWRNFFDFDPLLPLGGYSYGRALPQTVLEALQGAVPADWPVSISLQGEMGTTVMKYPDRWRQLLKQLRKGQTLHNARYGISLNHEGNRGKAKPQDLNPLALNALWQEIDFIGVSMYQRMSVPPTALDFAANLERFAVEFAGLGAPLPAGKELRLVEVGLGGGGMAPDGTFSSPAKELAHLARAPFQGTSEKDKNPWKRPEFQAYRRQYHAALCDFLRTQPARWLVSVGVLWSFGSWDPHGVDGADFADAEIVKRIQEHNAAVPGR